MFRISSIIILFVSIIHGSDSLNGQWKLIQYRDSIRKSVTYEPAGLPHIIEIEFKTLKDSGIFKGHTIFNEITGKYIVYNKNMIRVTSFGGTKVGEGTDWGNEFWFAMPHASSFKIKKDSLFLSYDNDKKVMIFIKIKK